MKKIMKLMLMGLLTLTFVSCGTIMQPARKTVTIHSVTPSKMFTDKGDYVGEGKTVSFKMDNRSGDSGDAVVLKEIGNEDNIRYVSMEREFNGAAILDIFCWPTIFIDFATGGLNKLSKTNYTVDDYAQKK